MQEINDYGAARTLYEFTLQQAKMPRQFWSVQTQMPAFAPMSVLFESMTQSQLMEKRLAWTLNAPRALGLESASAVSVSGQERSWANLISLLQHWNPSGSNRGGSIVFFSVDIKSAQRASMMLVHEMLRHVYLLGERPYTIEIVRSFELQTRFANLPDVAVVPTLIGEPPESIKSAFSKLLHSSNLVVAATNQSPQQFYDTYGLLPSHPFTLSSFPPVKKNYNF